ncbi:Variant surface glycoprotein [Trypanosoma congolense IL3000]|uniref:Variant surface glycoprotein n=1 Tax=Trypanosoma congolense (strain IL3000) TaxID=1068625 RepID=F9W7A4_TRYCI|nr:Variant surface glycoprotein [Trypanosoma congolense IL3000]
MGVLAADGMNKEVFAKLCNITRGVMGLMGKDGDHKGPLQEALYGRGGREPFEGGGRFTGGSGCGFWRGYHGRSQYCSHIKGGVPRGSTNNGCFGDSLLGTLLCTCVPGQHGQDFCGLGNVTGIGVWSGGWNSGVTQNVLKKVLDEVKKKCFENNVTDVSRHVGGLQSPINKIQNQAQKKKLNNGYYLGSGTTTNRFCDGMNASEACVTYKTNSNGTQDIPWVDKILEGIKKLNEARTQQQRGTSSSGSAIDNDHHELSDIGTDNDDDGEEEEGEEESAEQTGTHNASNPSRPKRKRTKKAAAKKPRKL